MAWPLIIAGVVQAGMSLASGLSARRSANKASEGEEHIAAGNAILSRMQTQYELANLDTLISETMGEVSAAIGASGFEVGSESMRQVTDALKDQFTKQREWLVATGAQEERIIQMGGQIQASNIRNHGNQVMTNSTIQGINAFGNAVNWFQKP